MTELITPERIFLASIVISGMATSSAPNSPSLSESQYNLLEMDAASTSRSRLMSDGA